MLRGPVVESDEPTTVETRNGQRALAEIVVKPDDGRADPVTVTLWGDWAEEAERLDPGMTVAVTDPERSEWNGRTEYETGADSFVIVEPDYLVNVTDVRSWVQCPRIYYLNRLSGMPLKYPVVRGTLVHEVFGDLLRGRDVEEAVEDAVADAGLELGLLGREREEVEGEVRQHARAIERWLQQGRLTAEDEWRSERTLIGERFGIKGRADAVRRGGPVELKTGKNTGRDPRFHDKVQAACYALMLGEYARQEREDAGDGDGDGGGRPWPDTGTLLYTRNAALDDDEAGGDLSPAKEFSIGKGLLAFVVRARNAIAAMEARGEVPTGYEADADCGRCFERDTCMVVAGRLDQESKAGTVGQAVPPEERAYFERFYRAVERERRAIHAEYAKLWRQPAAERADDDRALVDLEPLGREELDDGRWELRARATGAVSKIRQGDVVLASDGHPTRGTAELARVRELGEEIRVTVDEPLDLRRLDVYPSEIGVDRMLTALHDAVLKGDERRKDLLFGRREPAFDAARATPADAPDGNGEPETFVDNNEAQDRAVRLGVTAEDCALVQGPPGTGKTHTLARLVCALVERGERVLISAFTNRAVDNCLETLREQGFDDFVRVGTETGVSASMADARLEERGAPGERRGELESAPVVAATTASCGSRLLRESEFDVAVVDEAGQLTEPATLAAINRADRFVLVGDHQQLPPVVQSADPGEGTDGVTGVATEPDGGAVGQVVDPTAPPESGSGEAVLSRSLFERLIERYPEASVLLDRQYRMSQRIQYFASREFYDGALRPATPEVAGRRLDDLAGVSLPAAGGDGAPGAAGGPGDPVRFLDPDGEQTGNTNPVEADRVAAEVRTYLDAGVDPDAVGVIAPFRAQVAEIATRLPPGVTVDTVDRFQGSSREVIVVSFVATGSLDGPIFEDHRRVNVALTRAKRALCLVGDAAALESDPFYARMLAWARGGA